MRAIISHNNSPLMDELLSAGGVMSQLFETAIASQQSVDALPVPGTSLQVSEVIEINELTQLTALPVFDKKNELRQEEGQNIIDITLQTTGGLEALFDLCMTNGISPTEPTVIGAKIIIPQTNVAPNILEYYTKKGITVATGRAYPKSKLFKNGLFHPSLFE